MEESRFEEFMEMDPKHRYGHYAEVLGKGTSKIVYKGFDEEQGIEVAWNQIDLGNDLSSCELGRIISEVQFLQTLHHKNIIPCKDAWIDSKNNKINFITELFSSGSLKHYLKLHVKHVRISAIKGWARQILDGLVYLHTCSPVIIHRDLKCDNIFINGNTGNVKIGDMGFSTAVQKIKAHSLVGTPEFIAPDMFKENYDEKVDIYAFGMCVFEMVTGKYPYEECKSVAQIYKTVMAGKEPEALEKMKNFEVQYFIRKCLVSDPLQRPSAIDLLQDPFLVI